jgi:hypothetical protein
MSGRAGVYPSPGAREYIEMARRWLEMADRAEAVDEVLRSVARGNMPLLDRVT